MANNLFISYDLHSPGQDYSRIIDSIKSLGSWAKVQKSLWYVNSSLSSEQAAKAIRANMDANDSLIVIDTTNNDAYWFNVPEVVSQHIRQQWHM